MTTVDHKRIGIMYLVGGLRSRSPSGGIFALLVRLALLNPQHTLFGKHWVDAEMYNRFFTMHGVVMVFLFIIPSIPASLCEFRAAADAGGQGRRLSAAEPGELLSMGDRRRYGHHGHAPGGVDTGWTFYTPY